jgi:two-component system, LytTR family, response regulator LytT
MKIVVIEDEKLTAADLIDTIKSIEPKADIVAHLTTVEDMLSYFSETQEVDLVFSDIELGDGHSFEAFEQLKITIPIIFCTAYNQFALKAFETAGIDYILKPFSRASVQKALDKFATLTNRTSKTQDNYQSVFDAFAKQLKISKLPNIIVHQGEKIVPLASEEIALIYIDNTVVKALDFQNKQVILNYNLEELEQKLAPYFFRANRQFLVNRKAVKEASQHFNRKLLVHLHIQFSEQILVGKEKATALVDWLANF